MARSSTDAAVVQSPLAGLWQMPLLLVSLGLFTLAAYLFINPQPGPGFREQIERARRDVRSDRYDAAIGRLNDVLASPHEPAEAAEAHLLIAEALDLSIQRSRRSETPAAHRRILRETKQALESGATETPEIADRSARSWEALGNVEQAAAGWRSAVRMLGELGRDEEAVPMRQSTIDMLIHHARPTAAAEELKLMLDMPTLADDERAWALGELARISVDAGRPDDAMPLLAEALDLSPDEAIQGQVNFRMGYAAWKLGDRSGAEGYLSLARKQLGTGHFLDAEACFLLGRIAQEKISGDVDFGDTAEVNAAARDAIGFYEVVLRDHPGSRVAPKARLGRAVCRLVLGDAQGGSSDLIDSASQALRQPSLDPLRPELLDALRRGSRVLVARQDYDGALDLMAHEQLIDAEPGADFFLQLGRAFEAHADELAAASKEADATAKLSLEKQARGLWVRAGDAYVAYSRKLTVVDDEAYGDALWKGISLYEQAADLAETIAALQLFVDERPADPIAPDAMLRLGRAFQATGQQARAVDTLVKLRDAYPQSLAAAEASVPLAQAYVSQGRNRWSLAENTLRAVVENNPVLGPESRVFRAATWELGQLYYRMGRWGEALAKLEEFASRYPEDERRSELMFLRGDCYRQAAAELMDDADDQRVEAQVQATTAGAAAPSAAVAAQRADEAKREGRRYLTEGKRFFEGVVAAFAQNQPRNELERTYERLAYFYRADCLFDLGRYEEAIDLYDQAAFRYQDDPSSLSAYVQIVNAYVALDRPDEAKTANERAKWLLRRIPPESFDNGALALNRDRWQQWLDWAGETGVWQTN